MLLMSGEPGTSWHISSDANNKYKAVYSRYIFLPSTPVSLQSANHSSFVEHFMLIISLDSLLDFRLSLKGQHCQDGLLLVNGANVCVTVPSTLCEL